MMTKPAIGQLIPAAPQHWSQMPHGHWLREQVSRALAPHCSKIFGYHLARVGALAADMPLPELRVKHQFSLQTQAPAEVIIDLHHWPFAEHSLDAVLLINQLEFDADPHQLLREATHSLIADGYLMLVGMNPLSPALLTGIWPGRIDSYPWNGRYFTRARVSDWLALLNYELIASEYIAPSLMIDALPNPSTGLLRISSVVPMLGSMYVLVARKRRYPLTVVRHKRAIKAAHGASLPVANSHGIKFD
jgi:SAM-dependent methyltransferase